MLFSIHTALYAAGTFTRRHRAFSMLMLIAALVVDVEFGFQISTKHVLVHHTTCMINLVTRARPSVCRYFARFSPISPKYPTKIWPQILAHAPN